MQAQLDAYDVAGACDSCAAFLDVLTNWYIRRSRDRFWDGESDASTRRSTPSTPCSRRLTRVVAPLLPLTTEEIWRGLTGGRSVHLTDWPVAADLPADRRAGGAMDRARDICSAALGLRKAEGLRVRLPLPTLTVVDARRRARSSRSARSSPTRSTSAR